jgi:hypothetical protein
MKWIATLAFAAIGTCVIAALPPQRAANDIASPIFGFTIPTGYQRWELVAPSHEAGRRERARLRFYTVRTLTFEGRRTV